MIYNHLTRYFHIFWAVTLLLLTITALSEFICPHLSISTQLEKE